MVKPFKLWRYLPSQEELCVKLGRELDVLPVVAQVLINRGFSDATVAKQFLHGGEEGLCDPWLMPAMVEAVNRIKRSLNNSEKITIYGDYDVDGITATALMCLVLKRLGATIDYYIPERQGEGYGLNDSALEVLHKSGTTLVITVDCGISAVNEIRNIHDKMEIIVTDHHQPPTELPPAYAVVNPKLSDSLYPEKQLAGVGVAYKLCQALWQSCGLPTQELTEYLDLVAVGTIADIVPLNGENRILVKMGLERLANSKNEGLRALMKVAGIAVESITAAKVGFGIAPRLNAAGRVSHAAAGVELLLTNDCKQAEELAVGLNTENSRRQIVEKELLTVAENQLAGMDVSNRKVLVLAGEDWHPGVIGIVASRLVEKYYRPVVMISIKDGIGKGSCRSIPGFDIYRALEGCSDLLIQFGGHQQAAGLSIEQKNIPLLWDRLDELAIAMLKEEDYQPVINIDCKICLADIDSAFIEQLACLAPHGMGNPTPVFACEDLAIAKINTIGQDGRHYKLRVKQQNSAINVMAWDMAGAAADLSENDTVDIAFVPEFNDWQGRRIIQLRARDLRSGIMAGAGLFFRDIRNTVDKNLYISRLAGKHKIIIQVNNRQQAVQVAQSIRKFFSGQIALYHTYKSEKEKNKILKGWQEGRLRIIISSDYLVWQQSEPFELILYSPPLHRGVYSRQCNENVWSKQSTIHFLFSSDDVKSAGFSLNERYPERIGVGATYLILKEIADNDRKVLLSDQAIARKVQARQRISAEGVAEALKILGELGLLEIKYVNLRRLIVLKPEPEEKLSLNESAAFRYGSKIREDLSTWSRKLMQATVTEIWQGATEKLS